MASPKIAYAILSHKDSDQVVRLAKRLLEGTPNAAIVIHHDAAAPPFDQAALKQNALNQDALNRDALNRDLNRDDRITLLPDPVAIRWGEFSMVEAELKCIACLLERGIEFDWFVLLSGQDYLLQPTSQLQQMLAATDYDAFLEYFPATEPPETAWNWHRGSGIERYYYRYISVNPKLKALFFKLYRLVNWQPLLRVKAGRFGAKLAVKRLSIPFSADFQCYAGSQWHLLNRQCTEYVYQFARDNPRIVDYYRHTMVPDESFFQTVLVNQPSFRLHNGNLHHISWQPPYPAIFKLADFQTLVESNQFFARKFDPSVDSDILHQLDQHLSTLLAAAEPHG